MRLSVLLPSIRTENVQEVYDSIAASFNGKFELIIVGVNKFNKPFPLKSIDRGIWTFIPSYRSPNSAQQIALIKSRYEMISFCSDDGIFLPGALDEAFRLLDKDNYKSIVVGKYLEGDNPHPDMAKEDYYRFKYHKTYQLKGVPQDGLIFNCGIISRQFLLQLGGWDCQFEATTMAHADLGIRAMKAGANMILMEKPMFKCSHQPGKTGDHAPIHEAMKRDIKRFQELHKSPNKETSVSLGTWEKTSEVWKERFK